MTVPPSLPPDKPSGPSPRALARASLAALGVAVALAVGVVLPAETGSDPSGVGTLLGLTEMGRIKVALARDAAADTAADMATVAGRDATEGQGVRGREAQGSPDLASGTVQAWRDSTTITLAPSQGIELKLEMQQGDTAFYEWRSDGEEVYFHRHGEPPNAPKGFPAHSYEKGTAQSDRGSIVAVYDGVHGWFWRNWSTHDVRVTLKTRGTYRVLKVMP